jgi:WD domain, G-beta repeat.
MRQHAIEMNWRIKPIRPPKVLKGHDDHVITCLQFSGNRIVSGSDDNTLKVWSATTGKVYCHAEMFISRVLVQNVVYSSD